MCRRAPRTLLGAAAEDPQRRPGEPVVQPRHDDEHHRDEDDDHGRVGQQLLARRPDDLAQLSHDLADEVDQAPDDPRALGLLDLDALLHGRTGLLARAGCLRFRDGPGTAVAASPGPLLRAVLLVFDEVLVDLVFEAFVHGVFAAPLSIGHFPPSSVEPEDRQPRIQCLAASPASPASASPGLGVAGPVWPARAGAGRAVGAGATGLEPATCGFGDRCATNCATPLCEATLPATGAPRQGPITPRATSVRVTSRLSQPGRRS